MEMKHVLYEKYKNKNVDWPLNLTIDLYPLIV